jgi:hypothetical protein
MVCSHFGSRGPGGSPFCAIGLMPNRLRPTVAPPLAIRHRKADNSGVDENAGPAPGNDYEYDEAHDALAEPMSAEPASHRVDAPSRNLDPGGDYGYDEAHDFKG